MVLFLSIYVVYRCGGHFTGNNGTIISSNYPESYDSSSQCIYTVENDNGGKIQLDWIDFNLEGSAKRCYDHVEVFDGSLNGNQLLNSTCGNQLPSRVISNNSTMVIAFYSDLSINYKGFKAHYEAIP